MTDDQRALLDECTRSRTCAAQMHLAGCLASPTVDLLVALQRSVDAARAHRRGEEVPVTARVVSPANPAAPLLSELEPDCQVWEKRLGGTDIAETRLHLQVDHEGRVRVHEAVLVQLLTDAGWERAS